jgi:RNA polymerase sigma factor (TIGR02999 family)
MRQCATMADTRSAGIGGLSLGMGAQGQRAGEVTAILAAMRRGDRQAAGDLLPVVYDRLRRLATQMLAAEKPGQTLQPTALVHEAYLRLLGDGNPTWEDKGHFYGAAALAMRRILVDRARRRGRIRHGGGRTREDLHDAASPEPPENLDIVAVDEALRRLEREDPRAAQIVMLRFFAGLGEEDTARALDLSERTVRRDWVYAKAWLYRALAEQE